MNYYIEERNKILNIQSTGINYEPIPMAVQQFSAGE